MTVGKRNTAVNLDSDLLHHMWPKKKAWCVCVCVCVRVCVWMSVSEVSHWVGFARKETDSYRDSGLARPKGGKQGEMGVYGGLVN